MAFRKRSMYEVVLVTVVVVLAVVLGFSLYAGRVKVEKSQLLIQELQGLRASVMLYKTVNKKSPASFETLATETYEVDGTARPFLDKIYGPKERGFIDPFGNPYKYEPKMGWVVSTTKGFEQW